MKKAKDYYGRWVETLTDLSNKIDVVGDGSEAEDADCVICRLITDPLIMRDNLVGTCSKCFRMIQFRPHVPKTPPKVCDECAMPIIKRHAKKGDLHAVITENTAQDIANYLRKKGLH